VHSSLGDFRLKEERGVRKERPGKGLTRGSLQQNEEDLLTEERKPKRKERRARIDVGETTLVISRAGGGKGPGGFLYANIGGGSLRAYSDGRISCSSGEGGRAKVHWGGLDRALKVLLAGKTACAAEKEPPQTA